MHCYVKQIIQTLRVNDYQQADEENDRLLIVFARSRDYPSGKFAPKRKRDSTDAEKKQCSNRVDLKGK